jgi:hypothetical protein
MSEIPQTDAALMTAPEAPSATATAEGFGAFVFPVDKPLATIRQSLESLNVHIKKHGLPAAVKLDEKCIALCEKPFPLSEGNLADDEIQIFRIAHEMNGRIVDISRDEMNRSVTITIS